MSDVPGLSVLPGEPPVLRCVAAWCEKGRQGGHGGGLEIARERGAPAWSARTTSPRRTLDESPSESPGESPSESRVASRGEDLSLVQSQRLERAKELARKARAVGGFAGLSRGCALALEDLTLPTPEGLESDSTSRIEAT